MNQLQSLSFLKALTNTLIPLNFGNNDHHFNSGTPNHKRIKAKRKQQKLAKRYARNML